jgi:lipoprotein-releasing system permease protein
MENRGVESLRPNAGDQQVHTPLSLRLLNCYEMFLAFRYLRSRRKRRMVRVTVLVGIIGIACGVAALIIALSLANGFRDEMRNKILSGTSHITLVRKDGTSIKDWHNLYAKLKNINGIASVAATSYEGALVDGPNNPAYAVLRGVDTESKWAIEGIKRTLVSGSVEPLLDNKTEPSVPKVVIGTDLASRLGVGVGDGLRIVTANMVLVSSEPQTKKIYISGIFRSGLYEYDSTWIYMPLSMIAALSGDVPSASAINIETKDVNDVGAISEELRKTLGDEFSVVNWHEANHQLFAALQLERRVVMFVIALIVLIAVMNITTTLMLTVVERRMDIAILRTLGAGSGSIMSIFMIEGAMTGIVGACVGVMLGLIVCYVGDHFKIVSLPAEVYSISAVPFHVNYFEAFLSAASALLLSVMATIYPARAASKLHPVEILRQER